MARAVATRRAVIRGFHFKLLGCQHSVPLATSQKQFPSILRCVLREGLPSFTTCDLRGTHRQLAWNLRGPVVPELLPLRKNRPSKVSIVLVSLYNNIGVILLRIFLVPMLVFAIAMTPDSLRNHTQTGIQYDIILIK